MTVSTTYKDFYLDGGTTLFAAVEFYRKDGGHAGSRVVPGTTGEDGVGADHFVGGRVEEEGTVVGKDEEIAITRKVDKRVKIVFINV